MINTLENGRDKCSQVDLDKSAPKLAQNSKIAEILHTAGSLSIWQTGTNFIMGI